MRKRIMVVDDDRDVTDIFIGMLIDHHEVIKAHVCREALEQLRAKKPDLILIDLLMPEMDGWKLLSRIKARREYRDIPILILTDKPDFRLIENGIEHYIIKPVTKKELINTVEGVLNSKSKVRELEEAAIANGASKEILRVYEAKVKNIMSNQRLLSQIKQIMIHRKMEEKETPLNLMKSFERAIELEWNAVQQLQSEIEQKIE